jgi:Domain of unknown function (DUF397)
MSALTWRKSSYSGGSEGTSCVELTRLDGAVIGVRDSKNPEGGHLSVSPEALAHLVDRIRAGELAL